MKKANKLKHTEVEWKDELKAEIDSSGLHVHFDWEVADKITVSNLLMLRSSLQKHNLMISEKQADKPSKGQMEDYHINLRVLDGIESILEYFGHEENG